MAKYIRKPVVIEAITFEEFVQFGKDNGGNIVNGMPWHFTYKGLPVSHSNDECYLIPWNNGCFHVFTPLDVLITDENNFTYPKRKDDFEDGYDEVVNIKAG
ncbi:hypothetical protein VB776_07025 [Arcicella sp. DC2W]|uniref:Uncharacterized protein n=1 Tax=Arcicella gelida TaxID=2984195 RepID=A0ABU5S2G3_9BACT|nr:hypothetical protein [Arcicella sp. DC2W]MEA5402659.1 hypothetical protein [Arcicella sp. DC2W]